MPIEHQGRLSGILYLENNLLSNAFTPARLEILRLLSSQIAVSMENARLYVQERELARMQEEVRLAAVIQRDLLPTQPPVLAGYEILGRNIPAQTVGGDYYDYIRIADERLAVTPGRRVREGTPCVIAHGESAGRAPGADITRPVACRMFWGDPIASCMKARVLRSSPRSSTPSSIPVRTHPAFLQRRA